MADFDISKVDFNNLDVSGNTTSHDELIIFLIASIVVILVTAYASKKFHCIERISTNIKLIMRYVSGWALWCFLVFSYDQLFESYLDYRLWFTLPPLSMVLIIVWYRYFFAGK